MVVEIDHVSVQGNYNRNSIGVRPTVPLTGVTLEPMGNFGHFSYLVVLM